MHLQTTDKITLMILTTSTLPPAIHALNSQAEIRSTRLLRIFKIKKTERMSRDMKKLVCARLEELDGLDYTERVLDDLHSEQKAELDEVENTTGVKIWMLRLMIYS